MGTVGRGVNGKNRVSGFYTKLAICKPKSAGGAVTATT
nr:MAG TPA: hypothetical protein [Caudoviricetes sp.]